MRVDAATAALMRSKAFLAAEKKLGHVAVCLIGPSSPLPDWDGGNALRWPVALRAHKDPSKAAQRTNSEHWAKRKGDDAPVVTLAHVWTESEVHATRLKTELYARLLGEDEAMRRLNAAWVDLPEWEVAWPLLLGDALSEIRARRETVRAFGDEIRTQMILREAMSRR